MIASVCPEKRAYANADQGLHECEDSIYIFTSVEGLTTIRKVLCVCPSHWALIKYIIK